jgi:transcriptional regulator with XRE-family HTH domain
MITDEQIAAALKELRSRLGESQQTFASRLGMSINSIARYEQPTRRPSTPLLVNLWQIAETCDATGPAAVFRKAAEASLGAGTLSAIDHIYAHLRQAARALNAIDLSRVPADIAETLTQKVDRPLMEALRLIRPLNPFPAEPTTEEWLGL